MIWSIGLSRQAEKFLGKNGISREHVFGLLQTALKRFQGESVNIDIKKLKGEWDGFHRIRKGKVRIIAEFNFDRSSIFVEVIDWRGDVYK